nr:TPM domain-containing protein [bacterium]
MRKILQDFESKFPQLFISVYLGAFEDLSSIRQYGFWMLNRTHYVDVDPQRPNSTGILILVDVNAKSASITFGYALMPYLSEKTTFEALSAGHPFFLQGDYLKGLKAVIKKLEILLVKGWKRARKDPVQVLARGGQTLKGISYEHNEAGISELSSEKEGEVKE